MIRGLALFGGQMLACWWPLLPGAVGAWAARPAVRVVGRWLDTRDPHRIAAQIQRDADERSRAAAADAWERNQLKQELERRWASDGDLRALLKHEQAGRLPRQRTDDDA